VLHFLPQHAFRSLQQSSCGEDVLLDEAWRDLDLGVLQYDPQEGNSAQPDAAVPGLSRPEQALLNQSAHLASVYLLDYLYYQRICGVEAFALDLVGPGSHEAQQQQFGVRLYLVRLPVVHELFQKMEDAFLPSALQVAQVEGELLL
jgi:hypothetical protein